MSFENPAQEPTMNDVMIQLHQLEAQFTAEGNKDAEPNILANIRQRLLTGQMTPKEARAEALALAAGRIER